MKDTESEYMKMVVWGSDYILAWFVLNGRFMNGLEWDGF